MHPPLPKKPKPSGWRERISALRNVAPLLRMVWETSAGSARPSSAFVSLPPCCRSRCYGSPSSSWTRLSPPLRDAASPSITYGGFLAPRSRWQF